VAADAGKPASAAGVVMRPSGGLPALNARCSLIRVGLSISWLAVKGKGSDAVLRDLGLAPTGERDELPAESPIVGASLHGDWYAVVFDRCGHDLVRDDVLKRVSEGCDVVVAGGEEHVMSSFAAGWRNGERVWWSKHDAQAGVYDLEVEGSLPEGFDAIRRQRLDEQDAAGGSEAEVDYIFEIPLDAAKAVSGFSHDETEPPNGFAVLDVAS
jgi:hypothetical protein